MSDLRQVLGYWRQYSHFSLTVTGKFRTVRSFRYGATAIFTNRSQFQVTVTSIMV